MTDGKRNADLISARECKRLLLKKVEGKSRVSLKAIDKVRKSAHEELDCIAWENKGTAGRTVK